MIWSCILIRLVRCSDLSSSARTSFTSVLMATLSFCGSGARGCLVGGNGGPIEEENGGCCRWNGSKRGSVDFNGEPNLPRESTSADARMSSATQAQTIPDGSKGTGRDSRHSSLGMKRAPKAFSRGVSQRNTIFSIFTFATISDSQNQRTLYNSSHPTDLGQSLCKPAMATEIETWCYHPHTRHHMGPAAAVVAGLSVSRRVNQDQTFLVVVALALAWLWLGLALAWVSYS